MATKEHDVSVHAERARLQAVLHEGGRPPVRRGRVGGPRRRHPQLQGGRQRLRAAGRRVPRRSWSQNATNIVAQKYFRGPLGTPQRESSVRQMIAPRRRHDHGLGRRRTATSRRARTRGRSRTSSPTCWSHQKAAFNSPVWFNVGAEEHPQCSACFILAVEDSMRSILNWYIEEGTIFKGGSGSGINLSPLRSSKEQLHGGGTASGPVTLHARRRRLAPARSSRAARRGAPRRWSC